MTLCHIHVALYIMRAVGECWRKLREARAVAAQTDLYQDLRRTEPSIPARPHSAAHVPSSGRLGRAHGTAHLPIGGLHLWPEPGSDARSGRSSTSGKTTKPLPSVPCTAAPHDGDVRPHERQWRGRDLQCRCARGSHHRAARCPQPSPRGFRRPLPRPRPFCGEGKGPKKSARVLTRHCP